MRNIAVVFFIAFMVFGFGSCKKNPVEIEEENLTPGRRDYTWAVDTIKNPVLHFSNIWGNTPDNIWITGSLSSDAVYRFNGSKWILDNRTYIAAPEAVWGIGNRLWIGNSYGSMWQFKDNTYKQELNGFRIEGNLANFGNMDGSSEKEIYACGAYRLYDEFYPYLVKYNGNEWVIDKKFPEMGGFNQIRYCKKNDNYYFQMRMKDYSIRVYEYDRKDLKIIYSYPPTNAGPTVSEIDGYAYVVIDNKIYRYFNGRSEFIFEVKEPDFGGVVWGRSRKDIFLRMQDGLAHYNGTDIKYMFRYDERTMMAPNMAIIGNEIFIAGYVYSTGYTVIQHGKLK